MGRRRPLWWMSWAAIVLWAVLLESADAKPPPLRFRKDGTFHIAQFTDLHFGQNDGAEDQMTLGVMRTVLQIEKPDLVVLSGDAVSGYAYPTNRSHSCMFGGAEGCFRSLVTPMESMHIPWAFAFGNHVKPHFSCF